jgi:hypothetical protein
VELTVSGFVGGGGVILEQTSAMKFLYSPYESLFFSRIRLLLIDHFEYFP